MMQFIPLILVTLISTRSVASELMNRIASKVTVEVSLKIDAEVDLTKDYVYVGDVSTCQSEVDVCPEVLSVLIDEAPLPGETLQVKKASIEKTLNEEFPRLDFQIESPDEIEVISRSRRLGAREMIQALPSQVYMLEDFNGRRVKIKKIAPRGVIKVRPGLVVWNFHIEEALRSISDIRRNSVRLPVKIDIQQGRFHRKIEATAYLVQECFYPVAVSTIPSRSLIKEEDVELLWVKCGRRSVVDIERVIGRQAANTIEQGSVIKIYDFKDSAAIHRGQSVTVIVNNGSLNIKSKGKAMRPGAVGEVIDVKIKGSNKRVSAVIRSKGVVEVSL